MREWLEEPSERILSVEGGAREAEPPLVPEEAGQAGIGCTGGGARRSKDPGTAGGRARG